MKQKYEIEATINGEVLVCQGSIESKNGINKNMARIMCNEFIERYKRIEYIRFLLEGVMIYEA